jgi:hypothetical protein
MAWNRGAEESITIDCGSETGGLTKKQEQQHKEKDMTQETKPEQTPARAEKPAPAGKAEQPKGRPGSEVAVTELTDIDLQTVSGGGGQPGGVLGDNR